MKFVLSYSGGKDSVLAMKRAIDLGHEPLALLTTAPPDAGQSHFHKIPLELLEEAARCLGVPLVILRTQGGDYAPDFVSALLKLKQQGAQLVVFGDIDLIEHLNWCTARCEEAGLASLFPHWQQARASVVADFIRQGFQSLITVVNTELMDPVHLGRFLSDELVGDLQREGVDVCGEGGEFHSFVVDGPLFHKPVAYRVSGIQKGAGYRWLELAPAQEGPGQPLDLCPDPGQGLIKNSSRFFRNADCRYFPCHRGVDEQRFNCLFCFCPLYLLGDNCGGNFSFVGDNDSVKDCSACTLPHQPAYYDVILERLKAASLKAHQGQTQSGELEIPET